MLQPVPTCSLSSSCHSTVTSSRVIYSNTKILGGHHLYFPAMMLRYLVKTISQWNTSLGTLIAKLEPTGCRAAEYKSKIFEVSKCLHCNLEQMWHLWQNPQMLFVSTHGEVFACRPSCPGTLSRLPFLIPMLRCCLTTSCPAIATHLPGSNSYHHSLISFGQNQTG